MNVSTIILLIILWVAVGILVWNKFVKRFRPKDRSLEILAIALWPGVLIYWAIVETILEEL